MPIEKRLNPEQAQEEAKRIKNLAKEITGRESNPYLKEEYEEANEWLNTFEQGLVPEEVPNAEIPMLARKDLQNFGREALIKIYDQLSPKKPLSERFEQLPKTVQRKFLSPQTHQFTEDFIIEQIAELLKLARQKKGRKEKQKKPTPELQEKPTDTKAKKEYEKTRQSYLEKWEKEKKPVMAVSGKDQSDLRVKIQSEVEKKELEESEGIFIEICRQSKPPLFGESSKSYFSSEFDDELRGSDLYVTLNNNIILALNFTISTTDSALKEKIKNCLDHPFRGPKYPTSEDLLEKNTEDKNFINLVLALKADRIEATSQTLYQNKEFKFDLHSYYEIYEQILGQLELMQRVENKKPETKRNLEPINKALEYFQKLKTKMGLDHPEKLGIVEDPSFDALKRPDERAYLVAA